MRVAIRKADETLLLDVHGPIPGSEEEQTDALDVVQEAVRRHSGAIVLCLHEIDTVTDSDLGFLGSWLRNGGVTFTALGDGTRIPVVTRSHALRDALSTVRSPFVPFETDKEALTYARGGTGGSLGLTLLWFAAALVVVTLLLC